MLATCKKKGIHPLSPNNIGTQYLRKVDALLRKYCVVDAYTASHILFGDSKDSIKYRDLLELLKNIELCWDILN